MFKLITHFIAFCLGAWACSAVLLPAKKKETLANAGTNQTAPQVFAPREKIKEGGPESFNQGEIVQQLGAVSKQVFTEENIKQMQSVAGQLMQQLPQMLSALNAQKGTPISVGAPSKSEALDSSEIEIKKQLAATSQMLGVNTITEEEVRSLLEQERIAPDQKKLLEQYLELSRTLSEQVKK